MPSMSISGGYRSPKGTPVAAPAPAAQPPISAGRRPPKSVAAAVPAVPAVPQPAVEAAAPSGKPPEPPTGDTATIVTIEAAQQRDQLWQRTLDGNDAQLDRLATQLRNG